VQVEDAARLFGRVDQGKPPGRMEFAVCEESPLAAENFRALICTGRRGRQGQRGAGKPLHLYDLFLYFLFPFFLFCFPFYMVGSWPQHHFPMVEAGQFTVGQHTFGWLAQVLSQVLTRFVNI
jgi:hypothetical protein